MSKLSNALGLIRRAELGMYHCRSDAHEDSNRDEAIKAINDLANEAWTAIGYLNDACDELGIPHFGEKGAEDVRTSK